MIPFLGSSTVEQRVAQEMVGNLLESLRRLLPTFDAQESSWASNEIMEKITAEIIKNGGNYEEAKLGGFNITDWLEWSAMYHALKDFLDTEVEIVYPDASTKSIKPRKIIEKFYVQALL